MQYGYGVVFGYIHAQDEPLKTALGPQEGGGIDTEQLGYAPVWPAPHTHPTAGPPQYEPVAAEHAGIGTQAPPLA